MKLSKLILGAAITVAANSAMAAGPSPDAPATEQAGWVGLESCLSTVAAVIANSGCTTGFFSVNVEIQDDASGEVRCGGLLTYDLNKTSTTTKGHLWNVAGGGIFRTTAVADFVANYGTDRDGSMLYGRADMLLDGDAYDEHIIKDFWLADPGSTDDVDVLDDGLEIITKLDFPRAKWAQESTHTRPNGGDGAISITKTRIAPDSTSSCSMTYTAGVDNLDGFETVNGLLVVLPQ